MTNKLSIVVDLINSEKDGQCYKLVINKGRCHGIELGNKFLIYGEGKEIFDPESNESLGKIEIIRGRGIAIHVQEKITTLECVEKTKAPVTKIVEEPAGRSGLWASLYATKKTTYTEPEINYLPFDNPTVGDKARLIEND